ncbi:MAG: PKD domain-containing protein, partial [Saprospiraceae bacterium]|nr:PKD domain-containing protein [Saprospiraceae bacterium]
MHLSVRSAILMTACMILAASAHAQTCDASFRAEVSGCNVVSFIPTEVNPTFTYAWDFGDGKTSTASNPVHTYVSYGNLTQSFTAKLTLTKEGCTDTETQTVTVKQVPDATIEDASGNAFLDCSESGLLTISNGSTTKNTNASYRIDWGDGSLATEVATFNQLTHEYPVKGNYFIEVTVTGQNGCVTVARNSFIWSTKPNIGLNLPSNDDICLPGTARVIISGVENNTSNTIYRIGANDGSDPVLFNHPPPTTYDHYFESSSCGTTIKIGNEELNHAFEITIEAFNGCPNQKSDAGVGPIRTRTEPKAGFEVKPGEKICASDLVEVTSTAQNGSFYNSEFDSCEDTMKVVWDVFPASGYSFQQKNAEGLKINFSQPGTYTIRQIVENAVTTRSDADPLCAADTLQKTICIIPEPL